MNKREGNGDGVGCGVFGVVVEGLKCEDEGE